MRRDWDYVTMQDYRHDMDEQTQISVGVIEVLRRERDEARHMLALAVLASGGEISIPWRLQLHRANEVDLETARFTHDESLRLRARLHP